MNLVATAPAICFFNVIGGADSSGEAIQIATPGPRRTCKISGGVRVSGFPIDVEFELMRYENGRGVFVDKGCVADVALGSLALGSLALGSLAPGSLASGSLHRRIRRLRI
jgi:hypothetical protein